MCFSAEASFVGAAVVGGVGVATLTKVRHPRELLWAALPLAFAAHQLLEGLTWVALDGRESAQLEAWSVHLWVIYAWALLPLWIPLGAWLLEPDRSRRRWMVPFVVLGALDFAAMVTLTFRHTIEVVVVSGNLDYVMPVNAGLFMAVPYVVTTCVAPLLSSFRWVRAFAAANAVALTVAGLLEAKDFASIWCTFAAFLSVMVLLHFREQRRREVGQPDAAPEPSPAAA